MRTTTHLHGLKPSLKWLAIVMFLAALGLGGCFHRNYAHEDHDNGRHHEADRDHDRDHDHDHDHDNDHR